MFLPILMTLVFSLSAQAQERIESFNRVSLKDKFTAHLNLNTDSVRCSHIGYGAEELKISVPALKHLAVFDHANVGESEPCMTAGSCKASWNTDGHTVEDFLAIVSGPQLATIERVLTESFTVNFDQRTCNRSMSEFLETSVGGVKFTHLVFKRIGDLPFEICLDIQASL